MWPTPELPNGFHDAVLLNLHVNFLKREVRLGFNFWVGDLESGSEDAREAIRGGSLRLIGALSMSIDPPDPQYAFSAPNGVVVDGDFGAYPGEPEAPMDGLVRLWFYASTWNAKMTFTARECELSWEP